MKMTRSKIIAKVFLILGMLLLTGCQPEEEHPKETRLLLDWLPNPNHVPLYVGVEKGYFEKYGISLKILKMHDPSDAIPLLTSGHADLAIWYMPLAVRAIEKGAKVKPVGTLIETPLNCFLFRKNAGIRRPRDLSGKKIGYCIDGTETRYLDVLLENRGIVPYSRENVHFDLVTTLGTGKVDAIFGAYWNIEGEHLRMLGIETDYFTLQQFNVPDHEELIVLAKDDFASSNKDFIENFQKALQESIDDAVAHPDEAFYLYLQANPDKRSRTLSWEQNAWEKTLFAFAKSQEIDQQKWENFRKWLKSNELID